MDENSHDDAMKMLFLRLKLVDFVQDLVFQQENIKMIEIWALFSQVKMCVCVSMCVCVGDNYDNHRHHRISKSSKKKRTNRQSMVYQSQ